MKTVPLIVGLSAVALYLLCFQLKSAKKILACKFFSAELYEISGIVVAVSMAAQNFICGENFRKMVISGNASVFRRVKNHNSVSGLQSETGMSVPS